MQKHATEPEQVTTQRHMVEPEQVSDREERFPVEFGRLSLERFVPDSEEEKSFLRSHFEREKEIELHGEMKPWCEYGGDLEQFSGRGIYTGAVTVHRKKTDARYVLHLEHVCDTFHVTVNGAEAPFPDQVRNEVDVTELLREGVNGICAEVSSNLYNAVLGPVKDQPDLVFRAAMPYRSKEYGIWGNCYIEEQREKARERGAFY